MPIYEDFLNSVKEVFNRVFALHGNSFKRFIVDYDKFKYIKTKELNGVFQSSFSYNNLIYLIEDDLIVVIKKEVFFYYFIKEKKHEICKKGNNHGIIEENNVNYYHWENKMLF